MNWLSDGRVTGLGIFAAVLVGLYLLSKTSAFIQFYPIYLHDHAKPKTRWAHLAGTTLGLILGVAAIWNLQGLRLGLALLGCIVLIYAILVPSHRVFEGNFATSMRSWRHAKWAVLGDLSIVGGMYKEMLLRLAGLWRGDRPSLLTDEIPGSYLPVDASELD